jgi:hypothetical protein
VDYLDAVSLLEDRLLPVGAANYLLVEFNRQAFGRKRQMLYKLSESESGKHVARFAVYFYEQNNLAVLSAYGLMNHAAQFGSLALDGCANQYCRAPGFEVWQHDVEDQRPVACGLARKNQRPKA